MFDTLNTIDDLQRLIDAGFRESETLDYKDASKPLGDSDHKNVAKDVSAFANSVGGLIIYGIATADKNDKTKPTGTVPIAPRNIEIIQQVIAQTIARPIRGIRYKAIPAQGNPVAFLIDVPASEDAPHQNLKDNKYYRRNGPVSQPMPHDLVEMYFGRRLGPRFELTYSLEPTSIAPYQNWTEHHRLTIQCENVGARVARHLLVQILAPLKPWLHVSSVVPAHLLTAKDEPDFLRTYTWRDDTGVLHPEMAISFAVNFACNEQVMANIPAVFSCAVYAEAMRPLKENVTFDYDESDRLQAIATPSHAK